MPSFFPSRKKIKQLSIHPVADNIYPLIEQLTLRLETPVVAKQLSPFIEKTIRLEAVLTESGSLKVFSPLFELRLTSKTLHELADNGVIAHTEGSISEEEIEERVWGQFFKHIFISIGTVDDIALIQFNLKNILPVHCCQKIFSKNFLSEKDFESMTGIKRGKISQAKQKRKKKEMQGVEAINLNVFKAFSKGDANDE